SELVSAAWLPLVLAVVPLPSQSDAAFLAAAMVARNDLPLLMVSALATLVGAVLLLNLARAVADGFLVRALATQTAAAAPSRTVGGAWAAEMVSIAVTVAAYVVLAYLAGSVLPAEWQSPDLGGRPFAVRALLALAPAIFGLLVAFVVGEALRMATLRRLATGTNGVRSALVAGARDLAANASAALGLATVAVLVRAACLMVSYALLRTLWHPLGARVADGALLALPAPALLLGFVVVWLCLTLGSGGLRTWLTAWWAAELTDGGLRRERREERRRRWMQRPSSN
ncbi:MAG: hypothetical protein M3295_06995, partial [Chloroflexota bacterium]|nr:hypothetical protein [Chloroflexota bacterium]